MKVTDLFLAGLNLTLFVQLFIQLISELLVVYSSSTLVNREISLTDSRTWDSIIFTMLLSSLKIAVDIKPKLGVLSLE